MRDPWPYSMQRGDPSCDARVQQYRVSKAHGLPAGGKAGWRKFRQFKNRSYPFIFVLSLVLSRFCFRVSVFVCLRLFLFLLLVSSVFLPSLTWYVSIYPCI